MMDDLVIIEEREDEHSFISWQFVRSYRLPPSDDPGTITSKL